MSASLPTNYEMDTPDSKPSLDESEMESECCLATLINEVYKPLLITQVEAPNLVHFMPHIISAEQKKRILREDARDPAKAMVMLLEILSNSTELGRFQCFIDALDNAEYSYMSNILRGGEIKCGMENQKRIIEIFTPEIENKIQGTLLLPDLVRCGVINRKDKQRIEAVERNYGVIESNISLLGKIPHRSETWFEDFISVLVKYNYQNMAEQLDPDLYKKKLMQLQDSISNPKLEPKKEGSKNEDNENDEQFYSMSTVMEEPISVCGPAVPAENNKSEVQTSDKENVIDDEITELKQLNSASDSLDDLPQSGPTSKDGATGFSPNIPHSDNRDFHTAEDPNSVHSPDGKKTIEKSVFIEQTEDAMPSMGDQIEPLEMRNYQMELASPALAGKNTLVCAPTGSGKTHVAVKIIQKHLEEKRTVRKVIFLVNQVALADQQAKVCQRYLDCRIKAISGETQRNENVSFSDLVQMNDVVVVTAQILLDALIDGEVKSINHFTLMIFDECHHTHTKHPFNQIMFHYMDLKDSKEQARLPQIVGLTASVGVGKAKTQSKAEEHIMKLMANLDTEEITTVREHLHELGKNVSYPQEDVVHASKRQSDLFGEYVRKLMEHIEKMMSSSEFAREHPQIPINKAPSFKGSEQYTQWISELWKEIAKVNNQHVRRFFMSCRSHLNWYNDTLIIYSDARVKDALDYLDEQMKRWRDTAVLDETELQLKTFYDKSLGPMEQCVLNPQCNNNPKLEELREMIIDAYRQNSDSRGIIFVKTRDLVQAIENWMNETPQLRELRPIRFVGAQASVERGGMTKNEQVDIMTYFKLGKHKLIIATTVAQEGLDISKCNLVIMYDHVTNEIAMVQSRGRARAEDSSYILLTGHDKGTAEKQERNILREALMNRAMASLQKRILKFPRDYIKDIHSLQEDAKLQRTLEAQQRNGRYKRSGEFELRCVKCDAFGCMSSDIRMIQNAHHIVMDKSFGERVKIIQYPRPQHIDDKYEIKGKILCKLCGESFGTISVHKHIDFYVIKIANFLIIDSEDRRTTCKQWKKSPFSVTNLTAEDFKEILQNRQEPLNNLDHPHKPFY